MAMAVMGSVATTHDLRQTVESWRANNETIALVPTMGALHAGHLALVEEARRRCRRTVVSIFVNPTQFGAGEDYDVYPRDLAGDREQLARLGVDLLYVPTAAEMYAQGFATEVRVAGISEGLCAVQRPIHFTGVATVVAKLLNQCRPHVALFGEKDYQQLLVIRRLARDLDLDVEIVGVPTVRESDGLALSSRNVALSLGGRAIAGRLNGLLGQVARRMAAGEAVAEALEWGRGELISLGFEAVDYLELRHGENLVPLDRARGPARLLVAVHIDGCRLIDNIALE